MSARVINHYKHAGKHGQLDGMLASASKNLCLAQSLFQSVLISHQHFCCGLLNRTCYSAHDAPQGQDVVVPNGLQCSLLLSLYLFVGRGSSKLNILVANAKLLPRSVGIDQQVTTLTLPTFLVHVHVLEVLVLHCSSSS